MARGVVCACGEKEEDSADVQLPGGDSCCKDMVDTSEADVVGEDQLEVDDATADAAAAADVSKDVALASDSAGNPDTAQPADTSAQVDAGGATDAGTAVDSGGAVDAGGTDAGQSADAGSKADVGPAICKAGELDRCWIECVVKYAPECIHGDLPPRILGTRACTAGEWGPCTALETCAQYESECTPNDKLPAKYQCTDGTIKTGKMLCSKQLGIKCSKGYYGNWPLSECSMMCLGPKDTCPTPKAKRDCVVYCGGPDGPVKKGTQSCHAVCDKQVWFPCQTGDACLK